MQTKIIAIVGAVVVATAAVVALTRIKGDVPADGESVPAATSVQLPRLVALGAGKCIPCQQMKPTLDDLMENFAETFVTEFIDVWKNREEGQKYGIKMIPTQVFFDAEGKERFRHEGYISKDDILNKWKELGVE